ncbi:MAG TPA: winged helix-turn-helix domain-containing protein [Caulobacteraceae bacterium]|nr:winged helix-turn-helix domain-containing protein [Caulobacteraceae bacterium]
MATLARHSDPERLATLGAFPLGPLEVDPARRRITRPDGRAENLEPRVMQVLVALARAEGRIVSRNDLTDSCWPGVLVGEDALTRVIGRVRRVGEGVGEGAFAVETISKVGYRLAATHLEAGAANASPPLALPDKPSIAVLPFKNLSGDQDQEYLADAISEDIVTALSRWRWFFVIARHSSFTFKNRDVEPARIGEQLGVRYLITGSVRAHGERVRVAAQLAHATSGSNLWAEKFDRPLTDVFALRDEVAEQVAAAIEPAVLEGEALRVGAKPSPALNALDCFYRGMSWSNRLTPEGDAVAIDLFRAAVRLDPDFALGHAGLARALYAQVLYGSPASREAILRESLSAARAAVRLDPREATGHYAAAGAELYLANHAAAERDARLAVALNPNFASAHYRLGHVLLFSGQPKEATTPLMMALRLSPFDPQLRPMTDMLGLAYFQARDYAAALEYARRASQFGGGAASAVQVAALSKLGRIDEAIEALGRVDRAKTSRQRPLPAPWADPAALEHLRDAYRAARRARGDKL